MQLSTGEKFGSYEVISLLGKGGMGEVYKARDLQLKREVALKVLPGAFANDPDRLARFQREAEVLASLNHPNIAAIYGMAHSGGAYALVMELVIGESPKGPMSWEEAWKLGAQMAGALEYAHDRGVVHRDLKPANVMVTADGVLKLLDFGLAKAMSAPMAASLDSENSPTLTMGGTIAGTIMGTAGYMAPEQAKGKSVDKRADIWAFGVVLWELLAGERLFKGEDVADTLAQVLTKEADVTRAPVQARKLLGECLQKDPKLRLRDIGDAARLVGQANAAEASRSASKSYLPWGAAAAAVVAAAVLGIAYYRVPVAVEQPLVRFDVDMGPNFAASGNFMAAISPDGTRVLYRESDGGPHLVSRLLSQPQAVPIPGSQGANVPFFSPDGKSVGFFVGNSLKRLPVEGGIATTLCACAGWGSWSEDGTIITSLGGGESGLVRVPEAASTPQPLTRLTNGELTHRWPQALPGGKAAIFTSSRRNILFSNATVESVSFADGQRTVLVKDAYFGRYVPSNGATGHLLYMHEGALYAVAFDPERLKVLGKPTVVLQDVGGQVSLGIGWIDFSNTGTVVYRAGAATGGTWTISWLGTTGGPTTLLAKASAYDHPEFSPDGQRLAFLQRTDTGSDIYVYELQRDVTTKLTYSGSAEVPKWAPDGKHLVYALRSEARAIVWIRADGAGQPVKLVESRNIITPYSFTPDGTRLAYFSGSSETQGDIYTLPLDLTDPERPKSGKEEVFLATNANETEPDFSPDGRWIAINEGGEAYVRPFQPGVPGAAAKWQISSGGGRPAGWSRTAKQLFYETRDNPVAIMVVDYSVSGDTFLPGKPRLWSAGPIFVPGGGRHITLHPDGKRFAVFSNLRVIEGQTNLSLTFLLNFFGELRRRAPAE